MDILARKGARGSEPRGKRAAIVEALGRDGLGVSAVARQFGVTHGYVSQIAKDSAVAVEVLRTTTTQGFINKSNHARDLILDRMMQSEVIEKASLNQLAVAYGILTDKNLLLEGKATVIFGNDMRRDLNSLAAEALAEARRRGVTIDVTATEVDSE